MEKAWYHILMEETTIINFFKCFMKNRLICEALSQWALFWGGAYGMGQKDKGKLNATCKNIGNSFKFCFLFLIYCTL